MGLFGDGVKAIADKIDSMREEYFKMSANFKNLEVAHDKFVNRTEKEISRISDENEDVRRRVTTLEALFDSTIKSSTKEALLSLAREHYNENGAMEGIDPKTLLNKPNDDTED